MAIKKKIVCSDHKCYTYYVSFEKNHKYYIYYFNIFEDMCWDNVKEMFISLKKVNIVGMLLEFNANKIKSCRL